jgi:hypothetical protein
MREYVAICLRPSLRVLPFAVVTTLLPDSPRNPQSWYELHMPRLVEYGVEELHLTRAEAEALAHDVLLASVHQLPRIGDAFSWLSGAMQLAARSRQ